MRRTILLALVAVLPGLVSSPWSLGAEKSEAQQGSPTAASGGRFFEMRVYTAAEGKFEALNARFRNHTNRLFVKHGIELVGY